MFSFPVPSDTQDGYPCRMNSRLPKYRYFFLEMGTVYRNVAAGMEAAPSASLSVVSEDAGR